MLWLSNEFPTTVVLHRPKQAPKDEQVSGLDSLVCEMPLCGGHLSQGTTPSCLSWQAIWIDVGVEMAPIFCGQSAPGQIAYQTSIRPVQIAKPSRCRHSWGRDRHGQGLSINNRTGTAACRTVKTFSAEDYFQLGPPSPPRQVDRGPWGSKHSDRKSSA